MSIVSVFLSHGSLLFIKTKKKSLLLSVVKGWGATTLHGRKWHHGI